MLKFNQQLEVPDKNYDILTVGEILIDMISADYDDHFQCNTFHRFFGGSPSNIAMNVNKLGGIPLVASAVGNDGFGTFLLNQLHNEGIDTKLVQQVDEPTSMVVVSKSKATPVPIFYRGADYQLAYTSELDEAIHYSKIVHFSCWPISRLPIRHTIERILVEARKSHSLICFDPNYHPMIWEKGENGVEYVKSIIRKVDIVKPSEDDAERLFGKDTHENQIQKFLQLGARLVIMTIGKEGAIVSNGEETIKLDSVATKVVDTTGAGDAFWSGFYTAIIKGFTIKEALHLGMAVSAYKLKFTGAVVDLPTLETIKDMYGL